MIAVPA